MDVQLYVYDLSNGLARQMSMQFLGTQIDAVYHTSIVFNGVEYFFGAGIQMCNAGQSHHGRPMEIIPMGQTSLPEDVILDYLNSLKEIYTPESYDLFMHNCNNFSNDFAQFLVGKTIPSHITSLPKRVLDTPFGQMLRPQLDRSMRSVTQAPVPNSIGLSNGAAQPSLRSQAGPTSNGSATPPLPNALLRVSRTPVIYNKVPPLGKLVAKLDDKDSSQVSAATAFIQARNSDIAQEAPLPDLTLLGSYFRSAQHKLPPEVLFAAYDLFRLMLVDPRVSGFFLQERESPSTLELILEHVNRNASCPYNLRLVTIHMACNLFTSKTLAHSPVSDNLVAALTTLVANGLLDKEHTNLRVAAASLAYNMANLVHLARVAQKQDPISESLQVELLAAMVEVLASETSPEALRGLIIALGRLLYMAPVGGEVLDVCSALDAGTSIKAAQNLVAKEDQQIVREVAQFLTKAA